VIKTGGLENVSPSVVLRVFSNLQSVIVGLCGVLPAHSAASMQLSVEPPAVPQDIREAVAGMVRGFYRKGHRYHYRCLA
jgi:hypothetical protein